MSIHAALHHVTHYKYDRPVQLGPQVVRLRPAPHCRSNVLSYSLRVEPGQHFINWQQDPFANYQARLVFPEKTHEFKVTVDLVVEMAVYNPFDFFLEPQAENFPFKYDRVAGAGTRALPGGRARPRRWWRPTSRRSTARPQRTIDFLVGINQRLQQRRQLPDPHGARRADARGDAGQRLRLLPRLGLAAGAAAAPLRPGGALRLRLPDPAHARREGARRPERHRRSTSPTCTPGARSTCPAPAGSASTPPRA